MVYAPKKQIRAIYVSVSVLSANHVGKVCVKQGRMCVCVSDVNLNMVYLLFQNSSYHPDYTLYFMQE